MATLKLCLFLALVLQVMAIYPPPLKEELSSEQFLKIGDVCSIKQILEKGLYEKVFADSETDSQYYLSKVLKRQNRNQHCSRPVFSDEETMIRMEIKYDSDVVTHKEGYKIQIRDKSPHITITVQHNSGYVYALETLFQMIKDGSVPLGTVEDEPAVIHRGIMIDSARHFLKVSTISKLIESMPLSKLNILHWHLSDDESFTLKLNSHPELAESSAFKKGWYYTVNQVKGIIALGKKNGVSIVPEFDTPAHVRSWGLSEKWEKQNITIKCPKGEGYNAQFDLSKHDVYTLAQQVLREIDSIFKDSPYLHLGGDQVFGACWDLRPSIKTWMKTKLIFDYGALQMYWRYQMKQALSSNRTVIYWRNDAQNVITAANDVIHYWGSEADLERIAGKSKSKIILSNFDTLYINKGQGNIWWNSSAGSYSVWKNIYENFHIFPKLSLKDRILGAEVTLWGEVSNDDTLENNIWMRASAFAGKVWTSKTIPIVNVVKELVSIQYELYKMDVHASPITSEFCELKPDKCFH